MPNNQPPEEVELDEILDNFMPGTSLEFDTMTYAEEVARYDEAKQALLRWREAYADKARIDELERLYLVYGSKEKPASLDNLFSLGKKGEVCATPIKDRLSALRKQQGDT